MCVCGCVVVVVFISLVNKKKNYIYKFFNDFGKRFSLSSFEFEMRIWTHELTTQRKTPKRKKHQRAANSEHSHLAIHTVFNMHFFFDKKIIIFEKINWNWCVKIWFLFVDKKKNDQSAKQKKIGRDWICVVCVRERKIQFLNDYDYRLLFEWFAV